MGQQKQTQQKAHTAQSHIPEDLQLRREVLAPWLEGHMPNKIFIPLQSLVSLKPLCTRQAAVGEIEGLWQGLLPSVS